MRIYGSRICQKLLLDFLLLATIIAKADFPLETNFFLRHHLQYFRIWKITVLPDHMGIGILYGHCSP